MKATRTQHILLGMLCYGFGGFVMDVFVMGVPFIFLLLFSLIGAAEGARIYDQQEKRIMKG